MLVACSRAIACPLGQFQRQKVKKQNRNPGSHSEKLKGTFREEGKDTPSMLCSDPVQFKHPSRTQGTA